MAFTKSKKTIKMPPVLQPEESLVFKIRLNRFVLRDLNLIPFSREYGVCDQYALQGNFDGKKFVTQPLTPPLHDRGLIDIPLEVKFEYHMKKSMSLAGRFLSLHMIMLPQGASRDPVCIGTLKIDLHTLATGPPGQEHSFSHHSGCAGVLEFNARMELVTTAIVILQDVTIGALPVPFNAYLSFNFVSDTQPDNVGNVLWDSRAPSWGEVPPLYVRCSLRDLHDNAVVVRVKHCASTNASPDPSDPLIGSFEIPLQKVLRAHTPHTAKFDAVLSHNEDHTVRFSVAVEGHISFRGLPSLAQMVSGKNTHHGVMCGVPLLSSLPTPLRHVSTSDAEVAPLPASDRSVIMSPKRQTTVPSYTSASIVLTPLKTSPSPYTNPMNTTNVAPSAAPLPLPQNVTYTADDRSSYRGSSASYPARRNLVTPLASPKKVAVVEPKAPPAASYYNVVENDASAKQTKPNHRRSVIEDSRKRVESLLAEVLRRKDELEATTLASKARRDVKRAELRKKLLELEQQKPPEVVVPPPLPAVVKPIEVTTVPRALSPKALSPRRTHNATTTTTTPATPTPTSTPLSASTAAILEDLLTLVATGTPQILLDWINAHKGFRIPWDAHVYGPLHCACRTPRDCTVDIMEILMKYSIQDVNSTDNRGRTPLHYACDSKVPSLEVLHVLCGRGAKPDLHDHRGDTPFHIACLNEYDREHKLKRYLLFRAQVPIDIKTLYGDTALHLCSVNDAYFDSVVFLVEAGADVLKLADGSKMTCSQIAKANGPNASLILTFLMKLEGNVLNW
eukprot:PhF_6_TR26146/c0_g1_i1/m.37042